MTFNYAALNKDTHQNIKIKPGVLVQSIAEQHMVPVSLSEFEHINADLPVVYVKNSQTGEFESVAVTGLQAGENLWMENGGWQLDYIPQVVKRHPLALSAKPDNDEQLFVVIDENSELVDESTGDALFTEDGEESDYLKARTDALVRYHEDTMHGKILVQMLEEFGLLEPMQIKLTINDEPLVLNGIYMVDRKRMQSLSQEKLNSLNEKGYLLPVYAHLTSINRFEALVQKKSRKK